MPAGYTTRTMAKTAQNTGFRGLVHGKVATGRNFFGSALTAGRNNSPKRIPTRTDAGGVKGKGPGGDVSGGKSPSGRKLST